MMRLLFLFILLALPHAVLLAGNVSVSGQHTAKQAQHAPAADAGVRAFLHRRQAQGSTQAPQLPGTQQAQPPAQAGASPNSLHFVPATVEKLPYEDLGPDAVTLISPEANKRIRRANRQTVLGGSKLLEAFQPKARRKDIFKQKRDMSATGIIYIILIALAVGLLLVFFLVPIASATLLTGLGILWALLFLAIIILTIFLAVGYYRYEVW